MTGAGSILLWGAGSILLSSPAAGGRANVSITAQAAFGVLADKPAVLLGEVATDLLGGIDDVHPVLGIGKILGDDSFFAEEAGLVQFVELFGGVSFDCGISSGFSRHKASLWLRDVIS